MVLRAVGKAGWCCCGDPDPDFPPCDDIVLCASTFPSNWSDINSIGTIDPDWYIDGPASTDYVLDGRIWRQATTSTGVLRRVSPLRVRTETTQIVTWTGNVPLTLVPTAPNQDSGHIVTTPAGTVSQYWGFDQGTIFTPSKNRPYFIWSLGDGIAGPDTLGGTVDPCPATIEFEMGYQVGPIVGYVPAQPCTELRVVKRWLKANGVLVGETNVSTSFPQSQYNSHCDFRLRVVQDAFETAPNWPTDFNISAFAVVTT